MGDLMDHGGNGLHLAHALPDGDGLVARTEIPIQIRCKGFEADRHRRGPAQGLGEHLILFHVAGECRRQLRQGLAVRLRHVEHLDRLIHGDADFLFLHDLPAVLVQKRRFRIWVQLDLLDLLFEGRRGDDGDAALSLLHMASELVFPFLEARHQGGVGTLEIDEHGVVDAVAVEPAHDGEVGAVFFALEQLFDALLDAVRDFLEPFLVGFCFCHDGISFL